VTRDPDQERFTEPQRALSGPRRCTTGRLRERHRADRRPPRGRHRAAALLRQQALPPQATMASLPDHDPAPIVQAPQAPSQPRTPVRRLSP
jgi:hypothetical protein